MRFKKLLAAAVTAAMAAMMVVVPASAAELPTAGGEITSGEYTLTGDVTLTNVLIVPEGATVTINLNGYTLTSVAAVSYTHLDVYKRQS